MPDLDLARLREIAEKATPGPWGWSASDHESEFQIHHEPGFVYANAGPVAIGDIETEDAEFIATFNPATVLALLDRITELESAAREGIGSTHALRAAFQQCQGFSTPWDGEICLEQALGDICTFSLPGNLGDCMGAARVRKALLDVIDGLRINEQSLLDEIDRLKAYELHHEVLTIENKSLRSRIEELEAEALRRTQL